ncbi:helix-turn-helix domain-containing protein [Candidatus Pantoea formicae]|uniref:helix-turn-helix domain-containing protein n=1 Tax=Candidatus Pantoea formicae TaxID=2608355 RepID=UPI003ED8F587|nr:helix-turn-helix domain-containing protein [Erwiniaceae bacterium L1_54_3]
MSVKLSAYVWDGCAASGMKITSVAIMARLADFSSDEGLSWPSIATISRQIGAGPSTVRAAIRKLEGEGWLKTTARRKGNRNTSNMYQLNVKMLRETALSHAPESDASKYDTSNSDASKSVASVSDGSKSGAPDNSRKGSFHPPESGDDPLVNSTNDPSSKKTDGQPASPADPQQSQIDHQSILAAYHKILPEMPVVADYTKSRSEKLRSFWRKFRFTNERWEAYLRYIAENCRWMCESRTDEGSGKTWRKKNFDYLITERCYLSVKEERANDLPKPQGKRDSTQVASMDYETPDGWRGA